MRRSSFPLVLLAVAWVPASPAVAQPAPRTTEVVPAVRPAASLELSREDARDGTRPVVGPGKGPYTFRCWSNGRLIYEAAVSQPVPDHANVITVAASRSRQIVDLKDGLCILD